MVQTKDLGKENLAIYSIISIKRHTQRFANLSKKKVCKFPSQKFCTISSRCSVLTNLRKELKWAPFTNF
eukprot:snap_masked-scaffold_6-processed-gene-14.24-mRNA-1 protein AED:1.00 eAED:1.00 QI:0/0/0/0/1/1/2/0/68